MPSKSVGARLRDILHQIDLATEFLSGIDVAGFRGDVRTVYAVTRCLEIISEASRRLPDDVKSRHPAIAWNRMAGAGNVYRHDYEDVVTQDIWDTVRRDLPPLRSVMMQELGEPG